MVKYILLHLLLLRITAAIVHGTGSGDDVCQPKTCKKGQPQVRYPFWLKDRHPEHCGALGFKLSCNENNHTVLELPTSVKLLVKGIDYRQQRIQAYDEQGCVEKQLPNLTLSDSLFMFVDGEYQYYSIPENYTLFRCSGEDDSNDYYYDRVRCLDEEGFYFKYVRSDSTGSDLLNCSKDIDLENVPSGMIGANRNDYYFNWSEPACGSLCETHHLGCRANVSQSQPRGFECFPIHRDDKVARKRLLIAGIAIGSFLLLLSVIAIYWMYHLNQKEKQGQRKIEQFLEDYKALKPSRYSYADIKRITYQFKEKLGQGGYGTVFKGTLSNDVCVAVKILNNIKGNGEEFINEVGSMGRIHHVNVTRLVGFCADGCNRALVYEYLPNESLEKFIFAGEDRSLGWEKLHEIALGIAKGIEYLHQGCEQRILHFDIKPHNILLDQNFSPKISDFGLAKLCSKDQSAVSMTAARGTMGYIAPEVLSRNFGNVSYKSDVYSFGMLLLEMVGGRKNVDLTVPNMSQVYFPEWVYNRLEKGEGIGISIDEEEHHKIAKKLTIVGLWCIQWYPVDRPSMKTVVQMLEGDEENLTVPPNPFASKDGTKPKRPFDTGLEAISE